MRKLFWLLAGALLLWGSEPDMKLIRLEAMLFGKMIFLDYDVADKRLGREVVVYVVYDTKSHEAIARKFVRVLDGMELFGQKVRAEAVAVKGLKKLPVPTAYIAVTDEKRLTPLIREAVARKRLLFAYDEQAIPHAMIAIELGTRIVPVINPQLLKEAKIELRPIVFKVAKVYDIAN